MASTLDKTGESRPKAPRGHSTHDLGPSDSTDTGSDVAGGPGLGDLEPLNLDKGVTTDPDRSGDTAGPDVGDSDLDADSDASGTGENITAGRDPMRLNRDVAPDRIVDDVTQLDRDEPRTAADGADAGTDERGDAAAAQPADVVPSIDNPPPRRGGSDVPVADRDDGAAPEDRIDRTKRI